MAQDIAPRMGDWMQTVSGGQFWPYDPRADEIFIYDIAVALSNECRYCGHVEDHYSVAQHSVYVSMCVPPKYALQALLHDAPEAYCKDIHRPMKRGLSGYAGVEHNVWLAVAERFGLEEELHPSVKEADEAVGLAEALQLLVTPKVEWALQGTKVPADIEIELMTPRQARAMFLTRFFQVTAMPMGLPWAMALSGLTA